MAALTASRAPAWVAALTAATGVNVAALGASGANVAALGASGANVAALGGQESLGSVEFCRASGPAAISGAAAAISGAATVAGVAGFPCVGVATLAAAILE